MKRRHSSVIVCLSERHIDKNPFDGYIMDHLSRVVSFGFQFDDVPYMVLQSMQMTPSSMNGRFIMKYCRDQPFKWAHGSTALTLTSNQC